MMREPVKSWRSKGLIILMYLDDITLIAATREEALRARAILEEIMEKLGLVREITKGHWEPTQRVEILGLIIDTVQGILEVPADKIQRLRTGLDEIATAISLSAREVARTAGLLISVSKALSAARLFTRSLYSHAKTAQHEKKDWDKKVIVTEEVKKDAAWLHNNLDNYNGKGMWPNRISTILTTDSSKLIGWSKICQGHIAKGNWKMEEIDIHINTKELIAIRESIWSFRTILQGQNIQVQTDSTTALAYLKNEGG